jgi:putative transposase
MNLPYGSSGKPKILLLSTPENKRFKDTPNRWQIWDYSAPAKYFITICTQNREMLFGKITNKTMIFSDAGKFVLDEIKKLPAYHPRVILDEYTVMPNHIHLIIELGDYFFDNGVAGQQFSTQNPVGQIPVGQIHEFALPEFALPDVVNQDFITQEYMKIKSAITIAGGIANDSIVKQYRKLRRRMIIPMIIGKLKMQTSKYINILNNTPTHKNWQTDYHDHIIRDDQSYWNIKNYIKNNPANWNDDTFFG